MSLFQRHIAVEAIITGTGGCGALVLTVTAAQEPASTIFGGNSLPSFRHNEAVSMETSERLVPLNAHRRVERADGKTIVSSDGSFSGESEDLEARSWNMRNSSATSRTATDIATLFC